MPRSKINIDKRLMLIFERNLGRLIASTNTAIQKATVSASAKPYGVVITSNVDLGTCILQ